MKRSRSINLDLMRKAEGSLPKVRQVAKLTVKPLALAISGIFLTACSKPEEAVLIESVQDCLSKTTLTEDECQTAYEQAELEAMRTAPRYRDQRSCESEFGYNQCHQSGGFFMPFMMGYLFSSAMDSRFPPTVYRYNRPYSSYHNKVMTADGSVIGSAGRSSYRVNKSTFKPKATVTRTVSRGGFGAKASAKASWGGGKSKGWGG